METFQSLLLVLGRSGLVGVCFESRKHVADLPELTLAAEERRRGHG